MVLLKRLFFGRELGICNQLIGVSWWFTLRGGISSSSLLNSIILGLWFLFVRGLVCFNILRDNLVMIIGTLGDDSLTIAINIGMISVLFSNIAISIIALNRSSSAYRDGIVSLGGFDRIEIISVAAWCIKSANWIDGHSMVCGKNSIVSEFTTNFVLRI